MAVLTSRSSSWLLLVCVLLSVCLSAHAVDMGKYNLRTGKKFLDDNAKAEGVTVLPSGLQYKVLTTGSGTRHPSASDQVKVHYQGTLLSGKEFDSSYSRGSPATFGVGQVIKGWTEALQLMHEGDVWELYIPHDLAYGERGTGKDIGPNSVLKFKVELIEILGGGGAGGAGGGAPPGGPGAGGPGGPPGRRKKPMRKPPPPPPGTNMEGGEL